MKKLFTLFIIVSCAQVVSAQPTPQTVTPGSKGELPALSEISPARSGELNILTLEWVSFDKAYSNSNEALLSFPEPQSLGANGYIIQSRVHGTSEWETTNRRISQDGVGCDITVYGGATDFRLYITGGEYSGYVSNAVTVRIGYGPQTVFHGWNEGEELYKMVGSPIGATFGFNITVYDVQTMDFDQDAGIYNYQWYRQNPYNGDETAIEGATERIYTPVMDDCGYNMVIEVTGDGEHCNFTLRKSFGTAYWPVQAGIDYIGNDGFVLNTDYVLPNGGKCFAMNDCYNGSTDWEFIPVPENAISERKPGQYVFRMPVDAYNGWEFDMKELGYKLSFVYMKEWEEPPTPWYREVQVMADRYWTPLTIQASTSSSEPVSIAAVDIYGYNIDGGISFVKRAFPGEDEGIGNMNIVEDWENPSNNLYQGNRYFVKVIPANENLASTYYPNSVLWESASTITPGYDEEWNMSFADVMIVELPNVSGPCTIQGSIASSDKNISARRRAEGVEATETYSVLLKAKDGDIIAQTETDADGNYRFEGVPYDTYEVLVSVAGYKQSSPLEVTVDAANPSAEDIDYLLEDGAIVPDGIQEVQMSQSSMADCYDLSGRRLSSLGRGINIVRDANGKTIKVIVK